MKDRRGRTQVHVFGYTKQMTMRRQSCGKAPHSSFIPHPSSLILHPSSCLFLVIWLILLVGGRSNMLRDPGTFWHVAVGDRDALVGPGDPRRSLQFHPCRASLGGRPVVGRVRHGVRPSPGRLGRPAACDGDAAGRRLRLDRGTAAPRRLAPAAGHSVAGRGDAGRVRRSSTSGRWWRRSYCSA